MVVLVNVGASGPRPGQRQRLLTMRARSFSSVRKESGGGRDLYASPDGNIYQRRNDGWYRQRAGGGWSRYAPTQGTINNEPAAGARRAQNAGAGAVYRPTAVASSGTARAAAAANRVPNAGSEPRAQQVAALEREYYARSLAQARAQNWRASANFSRGAARSGGPACARAPVGVIRSKLDLRRDDRHVRLRLGQFLYATLSIVASSEAPKPTLHRSPDSIAAISGAGQFMSVPQVVQFHQR